MKKLEEIQSRKVMSAYGGVQSIIETAENGSLLVDYYDNWKCFNDKIEIKDPRLLNHIVEMDGYAGVMSIFKVPTPDLEQKKYYPDRNDTRQTIKSGYFPGWFYCPNGNCRRLHTFAEWKKKWEELFPGDGNYGDYFPACPYCSKETGKGKNKRILRQSLEQIRFLLASADSGKLLDVPFKEIWGINQQGKAWVMDNQKSSTAELTYRSSSGSDGLQSIYVRNEESGERISLSLIASKYIVYSKGENKGAYRLYLRNQNNIYYPEVINSLYIPFKDIEDSHKSAIISSFNNGKGVSEIYSELQANQWAPKELKDLSENDIQNIINGKLDYDAQEFAYIINPNNYGKSTFQNFKDPDFVAKKYPHIQVPFVRCMYAILRLKMTSVVPYFSRISTIGSQIQWWDVDKGHEASDKIPKRVKTYSNNNGVDFIPGVESYGEGIFFEMDVKDIKEEERLVFVHTYSHMIMKELEFQCGYPLSSMKEKLYSKNNGLEWGILIYTIGGAEGSYGGLVSLFPSDATSNGKDSNGVDSRIVKIINYAMERVKDCPNDPICEEEDGHCYACLDIPEISCCQWNQELNRNVFIKYKQQFDNSYPNVTLDD